MCIYAICEPKAKKTIVELAGVHTRPSVCINVYLCVQTHNGMRNDWNAAILKSCGPAIIKNSKQHADPMSVTTRFPDPVLAYTINLSQLLCKREIMGTNVFECISVYVFGRVP